ncbi:MAG: NAD(P)-dependent oxidoreductase [Clostridiales bacterium]|nr:NAD(P)-dependent oxidoreductase [Clostridiales bacterium]
MKIAIIGAAGKAGTLLAQEAVRRGHQVTAIVRSAQKGNTMPYDVLEKDLFDLTYADVAAYDVIIDAFGTWAEDTLHLHKTSLAHLAGILKGKPNRLLVVGGAGSLYVNPEHTIRVMDTPDFPEAFKPLAANMGEALDALKQADDVNWTYLSPAADFRADGARTGRYRAGGEELLVNGAGESAISYADYATAMIDEAEQAKHVKQRFTVVSL